MNDQIILILCIFGAVGFIAFFVSKLFMGNKDDKLRERLTAEQEGDAVCECCQPDDDRQEGDRDRDTKPLQQGNAGEPELVEKCWKIHGDHLGTERRRSTARIKAANTEQVAT